MRGTKALQLTQEVGLFSKVRLLCLLVLGMIALSACGQVITLPPTPTPPPTATIAVEVVAPLPPTATPAPYTPAPTPTPTVTPTPVVYVIRPGDSLLSIATNFNVSVAALQEVNGILDPRTLQVSQELIIPRLDELAEAAEATTTPTPLPFTVQNVHFSETAIGGLWVLGEVLNSSGMALEQVRAGVALFDKDNQEIGPGQRPGGPGSGGCQRDRALRHPLWQCAGQV